MILIVEDDPVARRALQSLFAARGYSSVAVPSAEEALGMLEDRHAPDVMLIDIDLPGMNGLQLLYTVQDQHPELPCMLMSANDYEMAQRSDVRAVPFLPKPIDLRKLLTLVDQSRTDQVA